VGPIENAVDDAACIRTVATKCGDVTACVAVPAGMRAPSAIVTHERFSRHVQME
jgi:hypothetical protein